MNVTVTGRIKSFEDTDFPLELNDEIEVEIDLKEIKTEVKEFAIDFYGLIEEGKFDECDCDAWELQDEDMIDVLEQRGYTVLGEKYVAPLDNIDQAMMDEIASKFYAASYEQRKELYNKIMNL